MTAVILSEWGFKRDVSWGSKELLTIVIRLGWQCDFFFSLVHKGNIKPSFDRVRNLWQNIINLFFWLERSFGFDCVFWNPWILGCGFFKNFNIFKHNFFIVFINCANFIVLIKTSNSVPAGLRMVSATCSFEVKLRFVSLSCVRVLQICILLRLLPTLQIFVLFQNWLFRWPLQR